ncbi:ABC transporter ATP-binding protein [Bacillus weihaiensis]|uniref:ABC transporter ATP-binding protein n=1 Tax=Bacillus weihaiensis TaxID=1547283 RepID=UPI002355181E|nr:ABC transporter ATP-binding protein [Bacillus weihaiensis]
MNTFRKLKTYYWPYKQYFLLSLFFVLIITAITVMYPIVLQLTIDEIVVKEQYEYIPYIVCGFLLLMVIKGISTFFHQYLGDMFGIKSVYNLRNKLYMKLQRLPFVYYDNAKTGDLMSRLTADVEGFRFFLSFGFSELVRFALLIIGALSVMFFYSIPLALVTLAVLPFLGVVVFQFDKRVHPAFRNIRKSFGKLNTNVQENISGIQTVKALSREGFEISKFNSSNANYKDHYLTTSSVWAKFFPLMEFIGNICVVALLGYGSILVINGELKPGELVAFFSLVWYLMVPIMNLGFVINLFSQAKASGERLLEILEADEKIKDKEDVMSIETINGNVSFNSVSLRYKEDDSLALSNVSFKVAKGKTIGLIGATGSGKTSVIQLLTRFYTPSSGNIVVDDHEISHYPLKILRSNIGVVLQESFLFSSTIKANISYGRPEASMEDIIDAAKKAQAHQFIMELPDGYDTMLGERGMGLSGGQKQRIAIARAICMNPRILILDDATSAVDMKTEFTIQQALKEVMKGRTTFIIAHRISSLKHADEILVFDHGEIVERGTHEELLSNQGYYRRIYDIQYKDQKAVVNSTVG